ncbi:MAG: DUF3795 domain-containing protein [Methanomicrobiales archaeon]|nr:DUF3795 domain-containing protein [Methanomicrobiales archaeon]
MKEESNAPDYHTMTAPCGLDCFNCPVHLAQSDEEIRKRIMKNTGVSYDDAACGGCRSVNGVCPLGRKHGAKQCETYSCVMAKGFETCADCSDLPCNKLQPLENLPAGVPHNLKVYNLALIRKIGLEKWAREKAKPVRDAYFSEET